MAKRRATGEGNIRKRKGGHWEGKHTFATLALQNGIDVKTVSSMLGHGSAGFTLATYTHATNKVQEQAAAKMGGLLKQAL